MDSAKKHRVSPSNIYMDNGQADSFEMGHKSCVRELLDYDVEGYTSVGFSFKLLGFFYRAMGLLIFSRRCFKGKSVQFVFSLRKTWFNILYSMSLWALVIGCLSVSSYTFATANTKDYPTVRRMFHFSMIVYRSANYLLAGFCMICKAPYIVKFVRQLIHLEKDIHLVKCELSVVLISSILLVLFQLAYAVRGAVMIIGNAKISLFSIPELPGFELPFKISAVIWAVVTSYGQTMVQANIIFLSIFFRVCFKRLNKEIEALGHQNISTLDTDNENELSSKLSHLRLMYEKTVHEVSFWQSALSIGILGSYAANLVLCCFGISIAITDTEREESFLFWELFICALVHLTLPTIASGMMKKEADNTKQVLNLLTIKYRSSKSFYDEIANFRLTLRSEIVVFSGAGLFDLDFPLILSIVQSIITYAVLLLQTTNTGASDKPNNETITG